MTDRLDKLLSLFRECPTDSFLLFAIAKEYEHLNDKEKANYYYQHLFEMDADYVGLYFHWGKLLEEMDEQEKALEIYAKGIEVSAKLNDIHAEKELRAAKYNCEMLS